MLSRFLLMCGACHILISAAVIAQTAPERVDLLTSHWYAEASDEALHSADRSNAILLALRGIPADPTQEDVRTYSDAFDALWRATASFSFRAEGLDTPTTMAFTPAGDRAVGIPTGASASGPARDAVSLWSTSDGALVAELLQIEGPMVFPSFGSDYGGDPFSPDGHLVSISIANFMAGTNLSGRVHVFETATGASVAELAGDYTHGFSRDGRRLMVAGMFEPEFVFFDTATWAEVARIPPGAMPHGHHIPFAGGDGMFYSILNHTIDPMGMSMDARTILVQLAETGPVELADLSSIGNYNIGGSFPVPIPSSDSPYLAFSNSDGDLFIMGLDGQMTATVPRRVNSPSLMAFVRGGQAVAVGDFVFGSTVRTEDISVFSLDGTELEPEITDTAPFLDLVANRDGRLRGIRGGPRLQPAPEWPTGLALYELVWPEIPAALQERIGEERITRDIPN